MSDEPTFWNDVLRSVLFSSAVTAAGWGALGGATSALTVRVTPKAMIRQVVVACDGLRRRALCDGGKGAAL